METKQTKWLQGFYDEVPPIILTDALSHVLGSQAEGEPFVYTYKDAVKLAGHSCPAVSGAYTVTRLALGALYKEEIPKRGEIRVLIKGGPDQLAYGPQAQVISFITGASGITGFKGLGGKGKFSRQNKLVFDEKNFEFCTYVFQREDTGKAVQVKYDPGALTEDPAMSSLAPKVIGDTATDEESKKFIDLWQRKVRKILLESDKHPGLFQVEEVEGFEFPEE